MKRTSAPVPAIPLETSLIAPRSGLSLDLREIWRYRDLFYFLIWRDIKVRYAQSVLGVGWAIIQPLFTAIVFTIVFGRMAQIESGSLPYAVFSFIALVPWTYFSTTLTDATGSLIKNAGMLSKVYFPRLVIPLTPVFGKLLDFSIALLLVAPLLFWYDITPTISVVILPILILLLMLSAAGLGTLLTALALQYRDINYAMSFIVQLLMYASPVVYSVDAVPATIRPFYALNPMVGVIEGFRSALTGDPTIHWDLILVGYLSAITILAIGLICFRQKERTFADIA